MNWLQPFFFCLQNIFPSPMYKTTNFTAYKLTTIYPPNKVSFMNFYSYICCNKYQI